MKLPRTMSEALKLGYYDDGFDGTAAADERTITGLFDLVKETKKGRTYLKVPYTAKLRFGRPRRFTKKLRRRP